MIQRSSAIVLSFAFLFAQAGTATAESVNCQMIAAKKADQNFKTNKVVTGTPGRWGNGLRDPYHGGEKQRATEGRRYEPWRRRLAKQRRR